MGAFPLITQPGLGASSFQIVNRPAGRLCRIILRRDLEHEQRNKRILVHPALPLRRSHRPRRSRP
jgi:hypothetical protein